ncbi:hypothetical protein WR25_25340 [Diploscapter pachys]|uniref:Uncharacterized protein n=1 Tax=Diploscapter pachys TaxID=2018661 RepID=A0A2A2JHG7_9BILA|nr:hypothetical protein WR25_25340 [Diploscapter pachys]
MPRRNRVAANFYASLKRNSSNAGGNQGPSSSKVPRSDSVSGRQPAQRQNLVVNWASPQEPVRKLLVDWVNTVADESSTDVLFDEDMKVSLSESSVNSSLENGPSSSKHNEDKISLNNETKTEWKFVDPECVARSFLFTPSGEQIPYNEETRQRVDDALPEHCLMAVDGMTSAAVKARGTDTEYVLIMQAGVALVTNAQMKILDKIMADLESGEGGFLNSAPNWEMVKPFTFAKQFLFTPDGNPIPHAEALERIEEALPEFPLIDLDEMTAACVKARGTSCEIALQTMAGMALYVNANAENRYEDMVESAEEQNELNEPAPKNNSNGNRRNFKDNNIIMPHQIDMDAVRALGPIFVTLHVLTTESCDLIEAVQSRPVPSIHTLGKAVQKLVAAIITYVYDDYPDVVCISQSLHSTNFIPISPDLMVKLMDIISAATHLDALFPNEFERGIHRNSIHEKISKQINTFFENKRREFTRQNGNRQDLLARVKEITDEFHRQNGVQEQQGLDHFLVKTEDE